MNRPLTPDELKDTVSICDRPCICNDANDEYGECNSFYRLLDAYATLYARCQELEAEIEMLMNESRAETSNRHSRNRS